MKTIVVYYSMEGNTDLAAKEIASELDADTLRIYPVKAYPDSGFRKFLWGGKSAVMGDKPALEPYVFNAALYDRVIIGFPVWASNMAPPLRTFIRDNPLDGKRVAAFACQAGSGAEKAFGKLKKLMGMEDLEAELILIDPKSKPDDDNAKKIRAFCEKLKERAE